MRPLDGVAWFLASAMLLLTLAGCGVFGLGALVLVEGLGAVDGARGQNMERVTAPVVVMSPLETATVMAPTVTAPTAVVVVEVAPTAVARSGLVLLPLVVGPVASAPAAVVAVATPDLMGCACSDDIYDCGDGEIAERCFDVCRGQGVGDVHNLDGDSDGDACED